MYYTMYFTKLQCDILLKRCVFLLFEEFSMASVYKVFNSKSYLNLNDKASNEYPVLVNVCGRYSGENISFKTHSLFGRKDYYLIYVTEGALKICIEDKIINAEKGSVVIFPPKYKYEYYGEPPLKYLYTHFTGSYVEQFLNDCGFSPLPVIKKCNFSFKITNDFNKLLETFNINSNLKTQKCAYLLEHLLISISDNLVKTEDRVSIDNSLAYIHSNYTKKLEIPTLAKMENLSNSRYITLFREKTGKSPNKYIIDLRIYLALDLLKNTDKPIKEIAEKVGYFDPYFFSALFKKHVGVSPKTYRKNNFIYR